MEDIQNKSEPTKGADKAQELQTKLSNEIKEAILAMERTVRLRRLTITEPLRYRYREII